MRVGVSLARHCLNWSSNGKELSQYQIEMFFGILLYGGMLLANLFSPTGPTELYLTLNPLPTIPARDWKTSTSAKSGHVELKILSQTALPTGF